MWKVMIADDEEYLLEAMKKLIDWESMDCELVFLAHNGRELITRAKKDPPDIIISDIKMPLADGMEVARFVYENLENTVMILLTGYADFEYAKEAIHLDVSDYVVKTQMLEMLPVSIKKALDKLGARRKEPEEENLQTQEDLFTKLVKYIQENYQKKLSLSDIADAVGANRTYISRVYKNRTGKNLFDAINQMKIDKAKEYLLKGMMIYEAADKVGFNDVAYFSRVFNKAEGCSPMEYKKRECSKKQD